MSKLVKARVIATTDHKELPLPRYKHVPGVNARPADGFLDSVTSLVADKTTDANAGSNVAWHYGIKLYNRGYYWECHEVLEAVWLCTLPNSRERFLLQGVIHLANSALKELMQRDNAAGRLKQLAVECFERVSLQSGGVLMGIDVGALRALSKSPSLVGSQLLLLR